MFTITDGALSIILNITMLLRRFHFRRRQHQPHCPTPLLLACCTLALARLQQNRKQTHMKLLNFLKGERCSGTMFAAALFAVRDAS